MMRKIYDKMKTKNYQIMSRTSWQNQLVIILFLCWKVSVAAVK